jgi:addiction module HigA family antidote
MSVVKNTFRPDYAVHPGEYLDEVLDARGMHKSEFAERCGLTAKTVSQIVNRRVVFSPEVAIQFETVLGISAEIWMGLLASYQLRESRKRQQIKLREAEAWAGKFPLTVLRGKGIVRKKDSSGQWVQDLLEFFNVSGPDTWERVYGQRAIAFRKSSTLKASKYAIATWLRLAEMKANSIETHPFDSGRLRHALRDIRELTRTDPDVFQRRIVELCAESGVACVFVPEVAGARISGATEWLRSDKAMIALSLRHKMDDHFWFTLFHEFGHVLLHGKKTIYVDDHTEAESDNEQEANAFARNQLVPKREYAQFLRRDRFFDQDIRRFAERVGIAPGIVVGMLQHDEKIRFSWHNGLKRRFDFSDQDDSISA